MKQMVDEGKIGVRLWVMVREGNDARSRRMLAKYRMIDYGNGHLTVRAIKQSDRRRARLARRVAARAVPRQAGQRRAEHDAGRRDRRDRAAGDAARLPALRARDRRSRQPRDAQHLRAGVQGQPGEDRICAGASSTRSTSAAQDIPRFGQLGVIASMQGIHCTSDAPYVLGAARRRSAPKKGAYVWQKLMKSGAVVSNGTDAPVEDVDPIANYYATVSRKTKDGTGVLSRSADEPDGGAEVLHAQRRLRRRSRKASRGSLKVGKYADMTVLSKDITTIPEDEIPTAAGQLHDRGREGASTRSKRSRKGKGSLLLAS